MLPKVELTYVKATTVSVTLDLHVLSKAADVERCATSDASTMAAAHSRLPCPAL